MYCILSRALRDPSFPSEKFPRLLLRRLLRRISRKRKIRLKKERQQKKDRNTFYNVVNYQIPSAKRLTTRVHQKSRDPTTIFPSGKFPRLLLWRLLRQISREIRIRMKKERQRKKDKNKLYNVVNYQTSSAKRLPTRVHQSRWYFLGAPHDDELRLRIIE